MKQNTYSHNLFDLLSTFNNTEFKKFYKFINSPYFNEKKVVIRLMDEFVKFYPDFTNNNITKDNLKFIASPSGNESTLRDSMSELYRLCLKFIGYENINSDNSKFNQYILIALSGRKLPDIFNKVYKQAELENIELKNQSMVDFSLNSYFLNKINYDEYINTGRNMKLDKNEVEIQNIIFTRLTEYYILQGFRIYYDVFTYKNIIPFKIDKYAIGRLFTGKLLFRLIDIIRDSGGDTRLLELYKYLIEMKVNDKLDVYDEYKNLIKSNSSLIPIDELLFHYLELIDFCIKRDSTSIDNFFAEELFAHYSYLLDTKLYRFMTINKCLVHDLYMNILINAIKLKKIKWLSSFITNYLDEVKDTNIENLNNISYAILFNSIGDYDNSQVKALKIKETNKLELKIRRVIIIRNLAEIKLYEEALKEIINYRAVIKRASILSEQEKLRLYTFLKLTESVIYFEIGNSGIDINLLRKQIKGLQQSWFYKSWLLKKADHSNP